MGDQSFARIREDVSPVGRHMMRDLCIGIIGCWIAVMAVAGEVFCDAASSITIFRHDCQGTVSEKIDCELVPDEALWFLESSDRPQISPGEALKIAHEAVSDLGIGPSDSQYEFEDVSLYECGKGWVYLVRFAFRADCSGSSQVETHFATVAVLMNGDSVVPLREESSNDTGGDSPSGLDSD